MSEITVNIADVLQNELELAESELSVERKISIQLGQELDRSNASIAAARLLIRCAKRQAWTHAQRNTIMQLLDSVLELPAISVSIMDDIPF